MAKARHPLNAAQLERRRATAARQKLWARVWLFVFIALLVAVVGFNIYTQIAHHP